MLRKRGRGKGDKEINTEVGGGGGLCRETERREIQRERTGWGGGERGGERERQAGKR